MNGTFRDDRFLTQNTVKFPYHRIFYFNKRGIVTRLLVSNTGRGKKFFSFPQCPGRAGPRAHPTSYPMVTEVLPGEKRPER
jgi:hypothetical protein